MDFCRSIESMKMLLVLIFLSFATLSVSGQKEIVCVVNGVKCTFTGQKIEQDEIVKIRVEPAGTDVAKITDVHFTSSSIYYLPAQLFDVFGNLKVFRIYEQNLHEIKPNSFRNATKLEQLQIHYNKLLHLYDNIFQGAVNLIHLHCGAMQVDKFSVDKDAFNGMFLLKKLIIQFLQKLFS